MRGGRTIAVLPCPINAITLHAERTLTRIRRRLRRNMRYRSPVSDSAVALKHAAGFSAALAEGLVGDLDEATVDSVLEEAGRFASDVIAPLNRVGDKFGTPFKDGNVTTPPGWQEAY